MSLYTVCLLQTGNMVSGCDSDIKEGCLFFFTTVGPHLIKNVPVEVRHVALIRQRSLIIFFKMLFKGQRVMGDLHYCAQVVGEHLYSNK